MAKPASSDQTVELNCDTIGSGPDLIILHGLFGSSENWRSQATRLATDFTVHSMDLRNHGVSPHTTAMNYPAMAADVIHTCHCLGLKRFSLLGHSMGGKTAMQLALTNPDIVDRLIIVDIGPNAYPHHHQKILLGLSELQTQGEKDKLTSRRYADLQLSSYVTNPQIRSFLLKNLQRNENGGYALRINLNSIIHHYDDIAAAISPGNYLPRDKPTLFIKGSNSDYLQAKDQTSILSMFPTSRLKRIGGAGHWPHSEKPDVVYKIVHDFLSKPAAIN